MASEATTALARVERGRSWPIAVARQTAGSLARVEVFHDLSAAEPHWRALERDGVLTPYQRFEWVAAWQRNDGAELKIVPLIVVGFDRARAPLFLWPLAECPRGRRRVGRFLGGKHANFNFGPWRRGLELGAEDFALALDSLRAAVPGLDALELLNQPESWDGMPNPLLALPHQPSPSDGFRLSLGASGEEILARSYSSGTRARLRNKERKLKAIPGCRYVRATTPAEVERYLAAFFEQKAQRFAAQGIENAFARPGTAAFLREAALHGLSAGKPVLELHVLDSDAGMLALFGGVSDGRRFSGMINSIALGEPARHSPGLILLNYLVASCAERGMQTFDLGVGEAQYKAMLCEETEPLFDSFIAISSRGRLIAPALAAKARLKRAIKRSPALWALAQRVRRYF
jgi:CelD/BcsL family acetyltransferase involved in cellulose biosynthesis